MRVSTKSSTGTSHFQLVYGGVVFPPYLGLPEMKFLQDQEEEPNDAQRRINQLIEVSRMM